MSRTTTIVTPPVSTALTTTAAALVEVGGIDPQTRLPGLIKQASSLVTGYIGREIARATVKDVFHGHSFRRSALMLSRVPVATLTSVTSNGGALNPGTLELDTSAGIVWAYGQSVEVTYDGGYILPGQAGCNLPDSIERACLDTVVALWHRNRRGDPMIRSESVEGIGSTSYLDPAPGAASALPPMAVAALEPFCQYQV